MEDQLTSKNENFQIVQLLEKFFKYWPWFVLSVMLCCGLAVLYVKSAPKQYRRTAVVLIKDEDKDITAAFSDRNPSNKTLANVNNEIEAFKSTQVMEETVRRLKLNINYVTKEGFRNVDLYTQSPIIAVFPNNLESESFSFQVDLFPDSMIVLSNFNSDPQQNIVTLFNRVTETPVGEIIISPTPYYSQDRIYEPIEVIKSDVKTVALGFASALDVSLSNKLNTVINLEIEDVSIQRAEDILNTVINVYRENWVTEKNKTTISTLSFLDERIAITEQELTEIDSRLAQFKSKNLVTDVRNAASLQMNRSVEYSGRILEVSNQISIVKFIKEYLNDNTKLFELLPANTTAMNNVALEAAISNYNIMLTERNRLIANSSEKNPMIVDRNESLQALRQSIIQTVDNLLVTLNLQLSGLRSQEARVTSNIASNPGQEKHLVSIEREQKIKESLYIYLLQQREENEMALIVTATNSQIISPPSGNMFPVKPNKYKILLMALMAGLGIPFGIILGLDIINITVKDKNDLAAIPVPLLGVIPRAKEVAKKGMLMVRDQGMGAINESFRMLHTNLGFTCTGGNKVIQITSMDQSAGKTFVALNLAMSFAVAGKKVALLDLDLRVATLSNVIGNPAIGVSNILNKTALDKNNVIQKDYFYSGFDIIPVGNEQPNPAKLAVGNGLANLIGELKNSYDYVIIDTPPVGHVADSIIIAQHADVSIFVVREKATDKRKLTEIVNYYQNGKFNNMHLVLNGSAAAVKYSGYSIFKNKTMPLILPKAS